jgi:hypothetical protein
LKTVIKRRIVVLERTWPRRKSVADFDREAKDIARLTGATYESAIDNLLSDLSIEVKESLLEEVRQIRLAMTSPRRTRSG